MNEENNLKRFCIISGKNMRREDLLVSPELQEIIDSTFNNECEDGGGNGEESQETDEPALKAKTHYIQMNSVQVQESVNETETDCYYSNNGNAVIFRETTV